MSTRPSHVVLLGASLLALSGCGGGPSTAGIEGSGIDNSGQIVAAAITSSGAVTELGSIFVNGVEYDLAGAAITIDGAPAAESDLGVGDIVIVEGTLDQGGTTGKATRVSAGISVAGPISAIDTALNRVTVLGQSVEIDAATNIDGRVADAPLGGLVLGDDVEVTGFADSTGLLLARRVAPRGTSRPLQVTGYVADLDTASRAFSVNGQRIDYGAAVLTGFDGRALDGAAVRVTAARLDSAGALAAGEVTFRDLRLPGKQGDAAQLQGWVTRFASEADFDVDGHAVVTTSSTRVQGPPKADGEFIGIVRLDAFVSIKGALIANGVIEAADVATTNIVGLDVRLSDILEDGLGGGEIWGVPLGGYCRATPSTAISIDGSPATLADLEVGDVATIHVFQPFLPTLDFSLAECRIVAVEHNVVGPLESNPDGSIDFRVMGQRIWLEHGFEALEQASVGDIVSIGGHTTAEGDIIASNVRAATAAGGYRVIGFAHHVDSVGRQFELGGLLVYYADAQLAGFTSGGPAEGDRVLVTSDVAPNSGSLRAGVVKNAATLPRGSAGALVFMYGLLTRFVSEDDLAVEGRPVVPAPWQIFDAVDRCDWSKVDTDLRLRIAAAGGLPGVPLGYYAPGCPHGRRYDDRGPTYFDEYLADVQIKGTVQAVDSVSRGFRVAGVDVKLHPASLLTHYAYLGAADGTGVTTPVRFEDVSPGDKVWIMIDGRPIDGGGRPVEKAWFGDSVDVPIAPDDVTLDAPLGAVAEPFLELQSGIRVRILDATALEYWDCGLETTVEYDNTTVWPAIATAAGKILVHGSWNGSEIVASRVEWGDGWWGPGTACSWD